MINLSRQRKRALTRKALTEKELIDLAAEFIRIGSDDASEAMAYVMAIVLRDKIGLSKPKTKLAIKEMFEYFKSVNEGWVDLQTIKQTVHEELKISFTEK